MDYLFNTFSCDLLFKIEKDVVKIEQSLQCLHSAICPVLNLAQTCYIVLKKDFAVRARFKQDSQFADY